MTSSSLIITKSIKSVGSGLACSGLIEAGTGIVLVFASLIKAFAINPKLKKINCSFMLYWVLHYQKL